MDVKNFVLSSLSSVMGDVAAAPDSFTGTVVQSDHSTPARSLRPSARISYWADKLLKAWDRVCLFFSYGGFTKRRILSGRKLLPCW
jgi:hypothetical protein